VQAHRGQKGLAQHAHPDEHVPGTLAVPAGEQNLSAVQRLIGLAAGSGQRSGGLFRGRRFGFGFSLVLAFGFRFGGRLRFGAACSVIQRPPS
jgi:hypothetical protein